MSLWAGNVHSVSANLQLVWSNNLMFRRMVSHAESVMLGSLISSSTYSEKLKRIRESLNTLNICENTRCKWNKLCIGLCRILQFKNLIISYVRCSNIGVTNGLHLLIGSYNIFLSKQQASCFVIGLHLPWGLHAVLQAHPGSKKGDAACPTPAKGEVGTQTRSKTGQSWHGLFAENIMTQGWCWLVSKNQAVSILSWMCACWIQLTWINVCTSCKWIICLFAWKHR